MGFFEVFGAPPVAAPTLVGGELVLLSLFFIFSISKPVLFVRREVLLALAHSTQIHIDWTIMIPAIVEREAMITPQGRHLCIGV